MDDIVKQALAKWPNVPACYGWLGLDARGRWYLRDDATQAAGPFPQSRGSLLQHEKLIEFIQRNYEPDAQGQWFFQNGPQRVYVELEFAPWVWRIEPDFSLVAQTGAKTVALDCLQDECGRVFLNSAIGVGLVHSLDMEAVANAVEEGIWSPQVIRRTDLPRQYGFVLSPKMHSTPL
jgi:hypothetical protein